MLSKNSNDNDKNNDSIVTFLRNVLNRLQQTINREIFKKRAKNLKKKINDNNSIVTFLKNVSFIINKTVNRDVFKKRVSEIEKKIIDHHYNSIFDHDAFKKTCQR